MNPFDPDDLEAQRQRKQQAPDTIGGLFEDMERGAAALVQGERRLVLTALAQVSPDGMTPFELDAALSLPRGRANALLHAMLRDTTRPALPVRRTFICRKDEQGTTYFSYAITPDGLAEIRS